MRDRPVVRRGLLVFAILFLVWLAWKALSGGFRQLARSRTLGQKIESMIQVESGLLSVLVILTCFWRQPWKSPVRTLWSIALVTTAGLSALVWGPPMLLIAALFAAITLLVARAVIWALNAAQGN